MAKGKNKKSQDKQEFQISDVEFFVSSRQIDFIKERKGARKNYLQNGYDFTTLSAAWAVNQDLPLEEIPTNEKAGLFRKEQINNNPDIKLVYQIIAYSYLLENSKNEEEMNQAFNVITDMLKYVNIAIKLSNAGFTNIIDLFQQNSIQKTDLNQDLVFKFKNLFKLDT